jgi:SAM-dependent methyltransferase
MATSEETHWEKAAKTRVGTYLTNIEAGFIFDCVDFTKLSLVVDIGAEAGRFSVLAANTNVTVVGIDIDLYSLCRLKQKNKDVHVILADAKHIPLQPQIVDAVFMIEVLDYIPEADKALSECYRILRPDSVLIFSFGNKSSFKSKLREFKGKSYTHSYSQVVKNLRQTGFKTIKKTGYNWLPFGRMSNNRLVPFFCGVEKLFRLNDVPSLSPWVIFCVTKAT